MDCGRRWTAGDDLMPMLIVEKIDHSMDNMQRFCSLTAVACLCVCNFLTLVDCGCNLAHNTVYGCTKLVTWQLHVVLHALELADL